MQWEHRCHAQLQWLLGMVHAGWAQGGRLCSAATSGLGVADNRALLWLATACRMPSPQMYDTRRAKLPTHPVFTGTACAPARTQNKAKPWAYKAPVP